MADEHFMDPTTVRSVAAYIEHFSVTIERIAKLYELQLLILKTSALKGKFGNAAHERFREQDKYKLEYLSDALHYLSQQANEAADEWERKTRG